MKYLITFIFAFTISQKSYSQELLPKDSTQIIAMINDWNKAWEVKDHVLAAKWYSNDATFTNAFGDKKKGQVEINSLLMKVFALPFVMSGKSETNKHEFQPLNQKNIIVHTAVVRKGQQMPDGSVIPDRQTTHLRVFKKNNRGWEIVSHLISDARDKDIAKH